LLTEKSRQRKVLTIINDRPDIAVLSQADGVHVGQEDLSVSEARQIVGAERLIGISTHSVDQLQQAVLDGANYAGIGPVFPSRTKSFSQHGGLALLEQVAAETAMPLFAIGGIDLTNVSDVVRTGIRRLAVASAITRSPDPEKAVKGLRAALAAHDEIDSGRQSMPVS
jgi:thiamine-phosphate pyrophosphorylase